MEATKLTSELLHVGSNMYHLKKPFELPEKVEVPQCMYHIKPVNNINLDRPQTLLVNGHSESRFNSFLEICISL